MARNTSCTWHVLDVLHMICTRSRPGHLSVSVGNSLWRSEEIAKNLELRLWMQLLIFSGNPPMVVETTKTVLKDIKSQESISQSQAMTRHTDWWRKAAKKGSNNPNCQCFQKSRILIKLSKRDRQHYLGGYNPDKAALQHLDRKQATTVYRLQTGHYGQCLAGH